MKVVDDADMQRVRSAVVPGQYVRLAGAARVAVPGAESAAQPVVELLREGDVVRAIDITCACGQHIRLRCVYGD
jgi:hypothetical protein